MRTVAIPFYREVASFALRGFRGFAFGVDATLAECVVILPQTLTFNRIKGVKHVGAGVAHDRPPSRLLSGVYILNPFRPYSLGSFLSLPGNIQ
jgi:hypothetical protein